MCRQNINSIFRDNRSILRSKIAFFFVSMHDKRRTVLFLYFKEGGQSAWVCEYEYKTEGMEYIKSAPAGWWVK